MVGSMGNVVNPGDVPVRQIHLIWFGKEWLHGTIILNETSINAVLNFGSLLWNRNLQQINHQRERIQLPLAVDRNSVFLEAFWGHLDQLKTMLEIMLRI